MSRDRVRAPLQQQEPRVQREPSAQTFQEGMVALQRRMAQSPQVAAYRRAARESLVEAQHIIWD